MMVYRFDEELQRMIYIYEEDPENLVNTGAGKSWYQEQLKIAEEVGVDHYKKLAAELANYKFKDENE